MFYTLNIVYKVLLSIELDRKVSIRLNFDTVSYEDLLLSLEVAFMESPSDRNKLKIKEMLFLNEITVTSDEDLIVVKDLIAVNWSKSIDVEVIILYNIL